MEDCFWYRYAFSVSICRVTYLYDKITRLYPKEIKKNSDSNHCRKSGEEFQLVIIKKCMNNHGNFVTQMKSTCNTEFYNWSILIIYRQNSYLNTKTCDINTSIIQCLRFNLIRCLRNLKIPNTDKAIRHRYKILQYQYGIPYYWHHKFITLQFHDKHSPTSW